MNGRRFMENMLALTSGAALFHAVIGRDPILFVLALLLAMLAFTEEIAGAVRKLKAKRRG